MVEAVEIGATPPAISAPTDTATNPQPQKTTPAAAAMNPPRKTILFGYTPPSNSSFFQPQIQGAPIPGSQPFYFQPQAAAPKAPADQYNFNVTSAAPPAYYHFQPPPTSQPAAFMNSVPPVGLAFYAQGGAPSYYPPQFGTAMFATPAAAFQPNKFEVDPISKQGSMNSSGSADASKTTDFEDTYGYPQQVMVYAAPS